MADTRESVADLVAKVKAYQRRGEDFKQRWYSYVQTKGSPNYDPNRHDIFTLRDFLAKIERNEIEIDESIRQGSHLNAAEAAKAQLVGQVKAFQRLGEEYKQKWYSFLHIKGAIHFDPNRQDIGLLKEFLVKHDAEKLGITQRGGGDSAGWMCMKCGDHNFARNNECRACGSSRAEAAMPTNWACTACGDDQPYENAACRMCGEPHYSQNAQDYNLGYMVMTQLMSGAAGSSDGKSQRAADLMNWNSATALNYDSKSKNSVEAELWAQRMAINPDADPEAAAAAAAAFAMQQADPEAAAAAMAAMEAQGVFGNMGAERQEKFADAAGQYAESFETMSFGKRPLSMQQYDPVEAFDSGALVELANAQAQEAAEAQADAAVADAQPPAAEAAEPSADPAAEGQDRQVARRQRSRDDGRPPSRERRERRDRSRRRGDRSRPRRREAAERSRSRQEAGRAAAKRKSGWDDGAPPEGVFPLMGAPPMGPGSGMNPPPQPGLGPPPMHSYPPLGANQQRPGHKEWSAGFAPADGQAPKKGRPGDWICTGCKNINFSSRKICHNDKCKGTAAGAERIGLKPGDWICPTCGDLVFASKSKCKMCQTPKQVGVGEVVTPVTLGMPGGDWTCPACGDHQFARNSECRLCKTPRPLTGIMWTCRVCGDNQDAAHSTCRMCGEAMPKGAFKGMKGMGKGGCCGCKGGGMGMNAVAFDPQDPIASINAAAGSFDPSFDPNAPMMVTPAQQLEQLQSNWMNSNPSVASGPAKPVGFTSFISAPGSAAPAPVFVPGQAAPSLAPEVLMNWNVTEEDKWAGDGWVAKPKWYDAPEAGGSTQEDWKKVGWQDNSHLFKSENPDDWKSIGWTEPVKKSSSWKD